MTDGNLNEAIDRAVREMMSVDPRPGFSGRVRARLATRPPTFITVARLAVAAALVIATISAGWLLSRAPRVEPTQVASNSVRRPGEGPVQAGHRTGAPATAGDNTKRPANAGHYNEGPAKAGHYNEGPTKAGHHNEGPAKAGHYTRTVRAQEEIPPFVSNVAVHPLASITPITVAPVGPPALDAPRVIIAPLDPIEPLRVDPLSTPQ